MTFTVAIVGRPNVGKSTLFNRLVGQKLALVDDRPGVTRDRRIGKGKLADLQFEVIDTAGFEDVRDASLAARMRAQTERAAQDADLVLFVVDAREGVTPEDRSFARWLRKQGRPLLLLANKSEGKPGAAGIAEAYGLGLGEPIAISAEHGEGFGDLYDGIAAHLRTPAPAEAEGVPAGEDEEAETGPIQLAVVGRPNVGKSSLINRLIREERLLTGPEPGLTRDAVTVAWRWRDRGFALVDTAGLRKRPKVEAGLEQLSTRATVEALRLAHVAVLVVDATQPLEMQDVTIAHLAIREGRALVIALNKWDLVEDPEATRELVHDRLETKLSPVKGVACLPMSVLTGKGLDRLLPAVVRAYERWNARVPTARLNQWLEGALARHQPPLIRGRRIKIRYLTQVTTRPPTFVAFGTQVAKLPDTYERYLVNELRAAFELPGVPIRLSTRQAENPFAPKSKGRAPARRKPVPGREADTGDRPDGRGEGVSAGRSRSRRADGSPRRRARAAPG
jgi:GTP-binding protein